MLSPRHSPNAPPRSDNKFVVEYVGDSSCNSFAISEMWIIADTFKDTIRLNTVSENLDYIKYIDDLS